MENKIKEFREKMIGKKKLKREWRIRIRNKKRAEKKKIKKEGKEMGYGLFNFILFILLFRQTKDMGLAVSWPCVAHIFNLKMKISFCNTTTLQ